MQAGDVVRVISGCAGYYKECTFATLVEQSPGGWWADFKHEANPAHSFNWSKVDPTVATWFIADNCMVPACQ